MKLLVVYNSQSGGKDRFSQLQAAFASYQAEVLFCKLHHRIGREIKAAAKQGCKIIIAAGGDGTVNAVAAHLVNSPLALGVIPVGTLNHFAKDLAMPLTIEGAVKAIVRGKTKKVDTAEVNGHTYINNSSIGMYPAIVRERQRHQSLLGKWPSALLALIKVMATMRRHHVMLTAEEETKRFRTPFIFIGNNSYQLRKVGFTNRTDLTSGRLSVYWVTSKNPFRIASIFLRALLGKAHHDKDFESLFVSAVTLSFRRPRLTVAFDGEVKTLHTPLRYKSNPGSLRVVVP